VRCTGVKGVIECVGCGVGCVWVDVRGEVCGLIE